MGVLQEQLDKLMKMRHSNLVNIKSHWSNRPQRQMMVITELVTSGSLRDYLKLIQVPRLRVIRRWC